jgi:hypothetical protein
VTDSPAKEEDTEGSAKASSVEGRPKGTVKGGPGETTMASGADDAATHGAGETATHGAGETARAGAGETAETPDAQRAVDATVAAPALESQQRPGRSPEQAVKEPEQAVKEPEQAGQAPEQAGQAPEQAGKDPEQAGQGHEQLGRGQDHEQAVKEPEPAGESQERAAGSYEQAGANASRAAWWFGAMTVVPAMLAAAWLLPSFPLLLTGRLSARPMAFMFIPLAGLLCYFAIRRLPASWPAFRLASPRAKAKATAEADPKAKAEPRPEPKAEPRPKPRPKPRPEPKPKPRPEPELRPKPGTPWWAVAATAAVAIAFTAWQIAEHTQQIIYLRDPATYLQTGYWIAHHGYLPIPDNAAAFGGPHPGLSFASSNYYPRGTGIVPQFMTGMPLVVAAAIWLGGIPAALVITPVIGGCAILSFGGLAGRLAGPRWAPAAAAVLALSLPEQYTSRSTFSEPLAEVLLFGGLCLLADSLALKHQENTDSYAPNQDMVLAALGGLALGLTILVRIDGLSDILPAVPFLGVLLAARSRRAIPFGIALIFGVGYGLADGYLKSRPYLDLEAPSLRPLGYLVAATLGATVALILATASPAARRRLRKARDTRAARWLPAAAAVITALIFAGFAVRPLVQTVAGETIPTSIAYVAELQKLAGLPVNGRQQYYEDSLYWVIWYLGVPAVLLGALGLAALAKRTTKALIHWDDSTGTAQARAWALPLMIALWVIVTVLYRPAVAPDQPWASRRLVPFVLPGLILGAIWAVAWLKDQAAQLGRTRTTAAVVATCGAASLLIPTALTTLDLSFTKGGVNAHGMAFRTIGAGELNAVDDLCGTIGPEASVVILDQLTADRFAQVVRGICGAPAAVLTNVKEIGKVDEAIDAVGRRPVFLAENENELPTNGSQPIEVVDLLTTQEAHNLTAPPTRTWLIHYTVWMNVPVETGA